MIEQARTQIKNQPTPAYAVLWYVFGMVLLMSIVYFFSFPWNQWMTIVAYVTPSLIIGAYCLSNLEELKTPLNLIDYLFILFLVIVMSSLLFGGGLASHKSGWKIAGYMPFLMVIPYVCGRLMRRSDIKAFCLYSIVLGCVIFVQTLPSVLAFGESRGPKLSMYGFEFVALIMAAALTVALLSVCARILRIRKIHIENTHFYMALHIAALTMITAALVGTTARGWLLAGFAGVLGLCLCASREIIVRAIGLLLALVFVATISVSLMPRSPVPFIAKIFATHTISLGDTMPVGPVLGPESCGPVQAMQDSVAIRWVLYQEAVAQFADRPVFGVGANRFGERSCSGRGSYPHSTWLQAFAELGSVGGLVFSLLILFSLLTLFRVAWTAGSPEASLVFGLLVSSFLADQFYGNYFQSFITYIYAGVAARMSAHPRELTQ